MGAGQARLVHDARCSWIGRQEPVRVMLGACSHASHTRLGRKETDMRTPFTGVGSALVTPFMNNGDLDEAAVRRLARRQIDAGIHFLCPCGTTGESPTLTAAERLRIVEIVVGEANGKIPILSGAGGYDT